MGELGRALQGGLGRSADQAPAMRKVFEMLRDGKVLEPEEGEVNYQCEICGATEKWMRNEATDRMELRRITHDAAVHRGGKKQTGELDLSAPNRTERSHWTDDEDDD